MVSREMLVYAIIAWNVIVFVVMGYDKAAAKSRHMRRVRERWLLGAAFAMGGVGAFVAMTVFRHKTLHTSFRVGVPVAVTMNIAIAVLISRYIAV